MAWCPRCQGTVAGSDLFCGSCGLPRPGGPAPVAAPGPDLAGVAVAIGGGIVMVGSFLPWVSLGVLERSGMAGSDGMLTVVLGLLIVLVGIAIARGSQKGEWIAGVALGALAAGLGFVDMQGTQGNISRASGLAGAAEVGVGLYAVIVGGVVAALASFGARPPGSAQTM